MFVKVKDKDGKKTLLNTRYITRFVEVGKTIEAHTEDNLFYELENNLISLTGQLEQGGELFKVAQQETLEGLKKFN